MICARFDSIVRVNEQGFAAIRQHVGSHVAVEGAAVYPGGVTTDDPPTFSTPDALLEASGLVLTEEEEAMLRGENGEAAAGALLCHLTGMLDLIHGPVAAAVAMRILARAGAIDGAPSLIEVTQAHIDGCTYIGPGGLRFAETLAKLGGKVAVPTTLNSNSVDRRRWQVHLTYDMHITPTAIVYQL